MKIAMLLAMVTSVLSISAYADDDMMPAGLWEMRAKMDMPGGGTFMPPELQAKMSKEQVGTRCVKAASQKWLQEPLQPREGGCEVTDVKTEGQRMTWKLKCAYGIEGEGSLAHNGVDAYRLETVMNSPLGATKMSMDGKKIADTCDKK